VRSAKQQFSGSSSGYTLIEMIIASVLVGALMAVSWGMMSMYSSYLTAGKTQAVEQQLIRSLLQILESDLQRVSQPDIAAQISRTDFALNLTTTDPFAADGDPFSAMTDAQPYSLDGDEPSLLSGLSDSAGVSPPGTISLRGNSSSLRIVFERSAERTFPNPSASSAMTDADGATAPADSFQSTASMTDVEAFAESSQTEGVAPRVEEFQTIIWQFQPPGMISGGNTQMVSGLYRVRTETLTLQSALMQQESLLEGADSVEGEANDATVDQSTLESLLFLPAADQSESGVGSGDEWNTEETRRPQFDVVPEVVSFRIEYFSGAMWETSWDSVQRQSLPVAVRIQMQLVTAENLKKLNHFLGQTATSDRQTEGPDSSAMTPTAMTGGAETPSAADQGSADPMPQIPLRRVERIFLLQPLSGPLPLPGFNEDSATDAQNPQASVLALPAPVPSPQVGRRWPTGRMRGASV
jgi:prepilin-type N-terminal cleavage/methylation domain-containing protein